MIMNSTSFSSFFFFYFGLEKSFSLTLKDHFPVAYYYLAVSSLSTLMPSFEEVISISLHRCTNQPNLNSWTVMFTIFSIINYYRGWCDKLDGSPVKLIGCQALRCREFLIGLVMKNFTAESQGALRVMLAR